MPNAHGKPQSIILFISFLWSFKTTIFSQADRFWSKNIADFCNFFFVNRWRKGELFSTKEFQRRSSEQSDFATRLESATQENSTTKSSTVSVDSALSSKVLFSTLQLCKEQCQERSSELFSSAKNINVKNANQSVFHILHCFFALSSQR